MCWKYVRKGRLKLRFQYGLLAFCLAVNILNVPLSAYAETKDAPSKIRQENKTPASEANTVQSDDIQPDEITAIGKALEAKSKFYKDVSPFFDLQPLPRYLRDGKKQMQKYDVNTDKGIKEYVNHRHAEYEKKVKNPVQAKAIKLKAEDRLDSAVNVSRTAFLKLVKDLEKIYSNKNHSLILAVESLPGVFNMGVPEHTFIQDLLERIEKTKYGDGFRDYGLRHASESLTQIMRAAFAENEKNYYLNSFKDLEKMTEGVKPETYEDELRQMLNIMFRALEQENNINLKAFRIKNQINLLQKFFPDRKADILKREIMLADCYSILGENARAISESKRLLPLVQDRFGKASDEALSLMDILGREYEVAGKYHDSERIITEMTEIRSAKYGTDSPQALSGLNALARIYIKLGNYNEAGALLGKINPVAKRVLPKEDPVRSDIGLSQYIFTKLILKDDNDKFDLSSLLVNGNGTAAALRRLNTDRAFERWFKMNNLLGLALKYDLKSVAVCMEKFGDTHHVTLSTLCDLCNTYLKLNCLEDSLELAAIVLQKSRGRYGEMHPCTVNALHTLADAYRGSGKTKEAKELDEQALTVCGTVFGNNSLEELDARARLAQDYCREKKFDPAISIYEEVVRSYKSHGTDNAKLWDLMINLAEAYELNGEYAKAISVCDEVSRYSPDHFKMGQLNQDHIKAVHILASSYRNSGQTEFAIDKYIEMLQALEKVRQIDIKRDEKLSQWFVTMVPAYRELASVYLADERKGTEILKLMDLCKARILTERYHEQMMLHADGISDEEQKEVDDLLKTIRIHDREMETAKQDGDHDFYLSLTVSKMRQLDKYWRCIAGLNEKHPEVIRFGGFSLTNHSDILQKLQAIPRDACFIDFTVLRENNPDNLLLACIAGCDGTVKAVPVPVDKNFFDTCHMYHEILSYPSLEHMQGEDKYLWKRQDGSYKIVTDNEYKEPGASRVRTAEQFENARRELAARISKSLITPVKDVIPASASRWIISPDGALNNVPFETLVYNGKALIDSKDVSYVPSLSVLKMMQDLAAGRSQTADRKELFAMGCPDYGGSASAKKRSSMQNLETSVQAVHQEGRSGTVPPDILSGLKWNDLPGTGKELNGVSTLFAKDRQITFKGKNASESNLKSLDKKGELGKYKYLLFATHGLFVPEYPEFSSIVLSQDAAQKNKGFGNDGYVTVGEWMGYKLNSDLVYLSACESGRGKYQVGEGIVGIPYALTLAGNQNTVMSLWKVEDESTAEFSKAFFEKLSRGVPQVKALNDTKREFLRHKRFSSPSVWSAFLLYGI